LAPVTIHLQDLRAHIEQASQSQLAMEVAALRAALPPQSLLHHGYKVYSQTDEDGILAAILARLTPHTSLSRTFIEIGCGDGRENNTTYLAVQGYRGCWCDADAAKIAAITQALGGQTFHSLRVEQAFVDRNTIMPLLEQFTAFLNTREPDVLSLDIDGNDLAVTQAALAVCQPRVLVVEYNALFPPPLVLTMAYKPTYIWQLDDYQGTSLQAWVNALEVYDLVACSLSGVNAFFVHREHAGMFPVVPISTLYQPPRYRLIHLRAAHPPSLQWVRQRLHGPS
jgi:hypothetical protein